MNLGVSPVVQFLLVVFLLGFVALGILLYRLRARLSLVLRNLTLYFIPEEAAPENVLRPLFVVSFAGLFIEVMLIRWVGTEVRIFAYFQNLALIACFLGFGLGCYWSGRQRNLLFSLAAMAGLVALVEAPFSGWKDFLRLLSSLLSLSPDSVFWGYGEVPRGFTYGLLLSLSVAVVAILLILLVGVMVPIGQWVGSLLDRRRIPSALIPSICWGASRESGRLRAWRFSGFRRRPGLAWPVCWCCSFGRLPGGCWLQA